MRFSSSPGYGWLAAVFILTAIPILPSSEIANAAETPDALAEQIRKHTGITQGLCVVLGEGDANLAAAMAKPGKFLVHVLTTDGTSLQKVRGTLVNFGIYGQASADLLRGASLPYVDSLVNLLVIRDLPKILKNGVPLREMLRVTSPEGVIFLLGANEVELKRSLSKEGLKEIRTIKIAGLGMQLIKPRPEEMDEWTHGGHDPGCTYVSQDEAIGPVSGIRWIAGPYWPMGWRKDGNAGIVTTKGRNFYITFNWASTLNKTPLERYAEWYLVARNSFNGLPLWYHPLKHPYENKWNIGESQLRANLVALEDRVFALLNGNVVACDASSGKIVTTFEKNVAPTKLIVSQRTLLIIDAKAIRSYGTRTGKPGWKHEGAIGTTVLGNGHVYALADRDKFLLSLDAETGKELWRHDISSWFNKGYKKLNYYKNGFLIFTWGKRSSLGIAAVSAKDGKHLWSKDLPGGGKGYRPLYRFLDGLIWIQGRGEKGSTLDGFDPLTGEKKKSLPVGFSGGCSPEITTESYFLSMRPLKLISVKDGTVHAFPAGRHACKSGFVVGNGLIYSMPHGCGKCVGPENLRGFVAYGTLEGTGRTSPSKEWEADFGKRLEKGPAYGTRSRKSPTPPSKTGQTTPHSNDWPTFRHDMHRSSATESAIAPDARLLWNASLTTRPTPAPVLTQDWLAKPLGGDLLTPPVIAEGKVFVALVETHQVAALDTITGKLLWRHTAGARVDTPPTIYRGLCLFGARDGWVYCLKADDGMLVWRVRAAPVDQRIVAYGQVESLWPVFGGVLTANGLACFVAGRSSHSDGGMAFYAAEPFTGKIVKIVRNHRGLGDLLVHDGSYIRISGSSKFGFRSKCSPESQPAEGAFLKGRRPLLDRSWHVHTARGSYLMGRNYQHLYTFGGQTAQLAIGTLDNKQVFTFKLKEEMKRVTRSKSIPEPGGTIAAWTGKETVWSIEIQEPFQVESMVLARDVLIIGGPSDKYDRGKGGIIRLLSATDGKLLKEMKLDTAPVPEGIAVASGRLYVSTYDGNLLCFGEK